MFLNKILIIFLSVFIFYENSHDIILANKKILKVTNKNRITKEDINIDYLKQNQPRVMSNISRQ